VGEARALDEAAEMLDAQRLPPDTLQDVLETVEEQRSEGTEVQAERTASRSENGPTE
jgi:hypothetical protein